MVASGSGTKVRKLIEHRLAAPDHLVQHRKDRVEITKRLVNLSQPASCIRMISSMRYFQVALPAQRPETEDAGEQP